MLGLNIQTGLRRDIRGQLGQRHGQVEEVGFASEIWFRHVCKASRFNLHYDHDVVKRKISKRLTAYQ